VRTRLLSCEQSAVAIFANNIIMRKFGNFVGLYFLHITALSRSVQQFFWEIKICFLSVLICLRGKIAYNMNSPVHSKFPVVQ
jgi:hypothetical protein